MQEPSQKNGSANRSDEQQSAANWPRIRELFEDALAMPVNERLTFLEQNCSDARIRREVEMLLAHDSAAGVEFLEGPSRDPDLHFLLKDTLPAPLIGRTIGAYTLHRPIAVGGMGTVFLAAQKKPSREVAVKVLHAGLWNLSAKKRFDAESHILGYLRHANIAQIFEAGTHHLESGATIHFFAMEYVPDATPITRYADDHSLALPSRLRLFLQLCDAVHHGHQKGVIHRDLKPSNVLVGGDGCVKVIDFGIARTTESDIAVTTMHTEAGQLLGTLAYMSPEQCMADPSQIDTTTDIYSLGMLLFELLTGRLPYDVSNMTIHAAARVICEHEPTRPSRFSSRLQSDAETIILKAIEKDQAKRYQSVSDFANDIRRLLHGEPISARPPTVYSRTLRWAARHPKKATTVICAAIVCIVVATTSLSMYVLDARPDHLEVTPDGKVARLLTWRDRPLSPAWDTQQESGIPFAELVERPDKFGERRVVLIGFGKLSKIWPGALCCFGVDGDWRAPLWERQVQLTDLPEELANRREVATSFGLSHAGLADVFQSPTFSGPEIITIFSHLYSYRVVQVLDLSGEVHFQFVHDGSLGGFRWLKRSGLLIFVGLEEGLKGRETPSGSRVSEAGVVFAIKPHPGVIQRELMTRSLESGHIKPVWYKYIHPANTRDFRYSILLSDDSHGYETDSNFGLTIRAMNSQDELIGEFLLVVNEQGDEVAGSRHPHDSWVANREQLPDLSVFALHNDPPSNTCPPRAERK